MKHLLTFVLLYAVAIVSPVVHAETRYEADVIVYGGTAAGVVAAISVANQGKSVVLYEPKKHLGGMVTGGLGRTDYGNQHVIGGMSREFFERNGAKYDKSIEWFLEPHVAEEVYGEWLTEAGVMVVNNHPGKFVTAIKMDGASIQGFSCGDLAFSGKIFIDASYEGDLMALADISYTWGREGQDEYGETLAGQIKYSPKHQFAAGVSPRDDDNELSPLIQGPDPKAYGKADKKIQAYNFRICMTQVPDNMVPWPKPEGYDPSDWDLLARYLEAVPGLTMGKLMHPALVIPNGKTDTNNNGAISTDYIGESWGYPEGTPEERAAIWEKHKRYNQGFLYFLAHDPRVPQELRDEMNSWGLAKDEFVDNDNWPHQLYIREARRMIGYYVMTQKDLQTERTKDDSIGMGSYNSDSHNVQRIIVEEEGPWGDEVPMVINEGDMQVSVRPYEIAYGALVPKAEECTNLLSVSTISASHVAYSSIRMEPQYMIMGEAAGVAAAHAIEQGVNVQEINVGLLQGVLCENGGILSMADIDADYIDLRKLPGIVLDEEEVDLYGKWRLSSSTFPYVGMGYAHEHDDAKGTTVAVYRPTLPKDGAYEVFVSYAPHTNRCIAAEYSIYSEDGVDTVVVNQRTKIEYGQSPLVSIGRFNFKAGRSGWIKLNAQDGAVGYLIADAIQWIPVEK